jgi:hypothetical protein
MGACFSNDHDAARGPENAAVRASAGRASAARRRAARHGQRSGGAPNGVVTELSRSSEFPRQLRHFQDLYHDDTDAVTDFGIEKKNLDSALRQMADFLRDSRENMTIITVGGPISTLMLRDRLQRRSLNFIGVQMTSRRRNMLEAAATYARSHNQDSLGPTWFHAKTMLRLPPNVHRAVTQAAISAREVVFKSSGLTILAAPWDYAFCATIDKLASGISSDRLYDYTDALAYLHRYIQGQDDRPVTVPEIQAWARSYGIPPLRMRISTMALDYHMTYGHTGIAQAPSRSSPTTSARRIGDVPPAKVTVKPPPVPTTPPRGKR